MRFAQGSGAEHLRAVAERAELSADVDFTRFADRYAVRFSRTTTATMKNFLVSGLSPRTAQPVYETTLRSRFGAAP